MDFMDFSRRLYRWASEGVDMYAVGYMFIKEAYDSLFTNTCIHDHTHAPIRIVFIPEIRSYLDINP